jgi:hypothetical protein
VFGAVELRRHLPRCRRFRESLSWRTKKCGKSPFCENEKHGQKVATCLVDNRDQC